MTATSVRTETVSGLRVASVEAIREHFPAMRRTHNGKPVAYLDGPGGTQVPAQVVDRVADYLLNHNANTHWKYPTSEETDALIDDARGAFADFVNGAPEEISFGANMTTITFHVARSLGRNWAENDEVVITELDHHANVAPWMAVARERGVKVSMARMNPENGMLDLADLERRITSRTKLVAVCAASNALGTMVDLPRVIALAKAVGALVYVDAVHYAPHVLLDARALQCDFVACSAYKFYGTHIGVLWTRREISDRLDVPKLVPAPDSSPERLETGTQNHEGIVGAGAAVDYLASLAQDTSLGRRAALGASFDEMHRRGSALFRRLWSELGEMRQITRYGPPPEAARSPTLSFRHARRTSDEVAIALAREGLFVSHGDFYAATIVKRLGCPPDGLVRIGCSIYTTDDEITRVVEALRQL